MVSSMIATIREINKQLTAFCRETFGTTTSKRMNSIPNSAYSEKCASFLTKLAVTLPSPTNTSSIGSMASSTDWLSAWDFWNTF